MSGRTHDKIQILKDLDDIAFDSKDGTEKPDISLTDYSLNNYSPESRDFQNVQDVKNEINRISVMKHPNDDDKLKYIASFESEFKNYLGISPISLEKAWIHNLDEVKLVDMEQKIVLREFDRKQINAVFYRLKGVDEQGFILLDPTVNHLSKFRVSNPLETVIDFNLVTLCQVHVFTVLKSDKIVTFVEKREGFACCKKSIPYLQLYSKEGILLRESKLLFEGKCIVQEVSEMMGNNNGDIIISGETHARCEVLIAVDSNFKFRFTFEGFPCSNLAIASLAADRMSNIYFVNHWRCIEVIDQNGHFLRTFSMESFSTEGDPCKIAIDTYDQIWIVTNLDKIIVIQL